MDLGIYIPDNCENRQ